LNNRNDRTWRVKRAAHETHLPSEGSRLLDATGRKELQNQS
jgi:hypothetical protein